MGADRAWWFGRSSKPRLRRLRRLWWVRFPHAPATLALLLAASLSLGLPAALRAQDTTTVADSAGSVRAPPRDTAAHDSVARERKPPIGPTGALIRSLLVPGLGQIWLGRKLTAAFFVAAEATTLTLALRAQHQARQLDGIDSAAAAGKRQRREDFFVLMAVNHVLSGLEAYVSSQLYDFPADVKLTVLPGGGVGARVSFPFRLR